MTSTSTRFTSSKSSVIFDPLSLICVFNSSKCSARIRPMSRIVVLSPSEYLSIFKVIFDLSDVPPRTNCNTSTIRNHMNYWPLNVEVGPIFQRSLKLRPVPVGAQVRFDSSNPIAADESAES